MRRKRVVALITLVAALGVGAGAFAFTGGGADEVAAEATTTTKRATSTTAEPTTTTTVEPSTTTSAPPRPNGLTRGDKGPEVKLLQERLAALRFDPGPADGVFGMGTLYAVQGFQKLAGLAPDGIAGASVMAALEAPPAVGALVPDGGGTRVEIDLPRQLLFLYKGGELRLISHISTGSGERYCVDGSCSVARTPAGSYRFSWRWPGWRTSRLGKLYNPVYFTWTGIAVHGSQSVPTYPASHGCVRIPMHIAEYFPSLVRSGDPVYVLDGKTKVGPPPKSAADIPPPDDPPSDPEPDTTTTTAPPPTTTTTTAPAPTTTVAPTTTTTAPAPTTTTA